jgi:glycyl-tRNA synthetase (class II)
VTIRERDTMEQDRVNVTDVHRIIGERVAFKNLFVKA